MIDQTESSYGAAVTAPIGLRAVAVGLPALIGHNRQGAVISGIRKTILDCDTVTVDTLNIAGDRQADLRAHGGVDKAVYCYPAEHLSYWEQELGYRPDGEHAPFGENLSTIGVTERDVCIGDVWRWGDVLLQVSQPRWPCYKLAMHSGHDDMVKRFVASSRSGWYFRVLHAGTAPVPGPIEVVERDPLAVSVHLAFAIKTSGDEADRARVLAHPLLAAAWRW